MLGKIEGKRRRGKERMRCLGGITGPMDVSLSKLWKSLETLPDKPRQHIKKQRHHFANKVHIWGTGSACPCGVVHSQGWEAASHLPSGAGSEPVVSRFWGTWA